MANTSEHISVRLPQVIMDAVRREAQETNRSVNWVIKNRLMATLPTERVGEIMKEMAARPAKADRPKRIPFRPDEKFSTPTAVFDGAAVTGYVPPRFRK